MIKDDGTVIHFNNPKVQASLSANTFAITGHAETKQLTEMLPGILSQLGADSLTSLRKLAEQFPRQGGWELCTVGRCFFFFCLYSLRNWPMLPPLVYLKFLTTKPPKQKTSMKRMMTSQVGHIEFRFCTNVKSYFPNLHAPDAFSLLRSGRELRRSIEEWGKLIARH